MKEQNKIETIFNDSRLQIYYQCWKAVGVWEKTQNEMNQFAESNPLKDGIKKETNEEVGSDCVCIHASDFLKMIYYARNSEDFPYEKWHTEENEKSRETFKKRISFSFPFISYPVYNVKYFTIFEYYSTNINNILFAS